MIRQKIKILMIAMLVLPIFALSSVPAIAAFNPLDEACKTEEAARSPACQQAKAQGTTNPVAGPNGVINKAANIVASIAVIGAVIMILIGGLSYITSAGNSESAKKAKAEIVAALIGIVVVALAWAIVRLITDRVLG
ncbi:hypothetical protein HYW36_01820 [Candidatus Saccharibacteria bacterium]|nr:hypothetical protein [Candidatus Saccharibacteria bacterium]